MASRTIIVEKKHFAGYSYVKKAVVKNTKYWRCCERVKLRCHSGLIEDLNTGDVKNGKVRHTHPPDNIRVEKQKIYSLAKNITLASPGKRACQIYKEVMDQCNDSVARELPMPESFKRKIRKWKTKCFSQYKESANRNEPSEIPAEFLNIQRIEL